MASALLQLLFYRDGGTHALSDLPGRFFAWGLSAHRIPYVDAPVEYPVGIGFVGYLTTVLGESAGWFFVLNAALNAALAFVMTTLLRVGSRGRIWRWILGTPLLFYAFHNWDLWAIVPMVLGVHAFNERRDLRCGLALGVGASMKLFPALAVPPFAAMRWFSGDRRGAVRLVGSAAATTLVLNAPVALTNADGWLFPLLFQGARSASWGSLWFWIERLPLIDRIFAVSPTTVVNAASLVALAGGLAAISVISARRRLDGASVAAAAIALFLLVNKIYSPAYDLWLVPFFVLLPIRRRIWVAYCAVDAGVYVLVFGFFHGLWASSVVHGVLWVFVVLRAVVLVKVLALALSGRTGSDPTNGDAARSAPARGIEASPSG